MTRPLPFLICLVLVFLFGNLDSDLAVAQTLKYQFPLEALSKFDPIHAQIKKDEKTNRPFLEIQTDSNSTNIRFPGVEDGFAWARARYLVLELEHENPHALILYLSFFNNVRADFPGLELKAGVLPGLRTQFIFPLSYLNGQSIYLPKYPRQLKGYVSGTGILASDIQKVEMKFGPTQKGKFQPGLKIFSAWLSETLPENLPQVSKPYVDEFGQWASKDWKGKTKKLSELKSELESRINKFAQSKSKASKFGGFTGRKHAGTGFFRTHFDGKRWWFIDPEGFPFLSSGVNSIRPGSASPVSGNEDLYPLLPDPGQAGKGIYVVNRGMIQFNSLAHNLKNTFGENWLSDWRKLAKNDLLDLGYNTIGNWSDHQFIAEAQMPYVFPMAGFPRTSSFVFRDFPDVWDPGFKDSCQKFGNQLVSLKNDPFMIGYFLSNEPEWAFGNHNIAAELFSLPGKSYTRTAIIQWLRLKYKDKISELNQTWGENFLRFEDLDSGRYQLGENARAELRPFTEQLVDSLIAKVCRAVKKADPNHLNLGLRYAWVSSDLCYRAASFFDVFSLNGYSNLAPGQTKEITRKTGKPVLIGEFHFGSLDRGLPASGIVAAENIQERAWAIRTYMEEAFSRPEIIGAHYFLMYDQPVLGRFDGENYNIGLYDICLQPYPELKAEIRKAHNRLYKLARRKKKPYFPKLEHVVPLYY